MFIYRKIFKLICFTVRNEEIILFIIIPLNFVHINLCTKIVLEKPAILYNLYYIILSVIFVYFKQIICKQTSDKDNAKVIKLK